MKVAEQDNNLPQVAAQLALLNQPDNYSAIPEEIYLENRNIIANYYDQFYGLTSDIYNQFIQEFTSNYELPASPQIADIGCASGEIGQALELCCPEKFNLVGVELAADLVKVTKDNINNRKIL